jgi:ubiquinone/menaquinone biosynthesis C-methylase UbiE
MTELELLVDLHKDNLRQGPGSKEETLKALSFLNLNTDEEIKIADIGCGTGAQTIVLAQHTNSQILAVDLFPAFLNKLEEKTSELHLSHRVKILCRSMDNLSFEQECFDVFWSEGAAYIMGFKNALNWKPFIKKNGYLVVSEVCWTTLSRPQEIEIFWNNAYPEMDTISNKIKAIEHCGYRPIGFFVLPTNCWIENYYQPLEKQIPGFQRK